jgi:glycosyltransferase involved in cell wall biosynthesis
MQVSVVIPTCNRPDRLRALLDNLNRSTLPLREVLVVDSSDHRLGAEAFAGLDRLSVVYLEAARSVCLQRNAGIRAATSPWIFLCDDDMEVPPDYLARLAAHAAAHPACGAVSGVVLEKQAGGWSGQFPETSSLVVAWKFLFEMGIWGPIRARGPIARAIAGRCRARGNHLARSGWPVITEMDGAFFRTPIYALGASLVKRDWLLASPFDESLDSHGLGDNYGVAIGFPRKGDGDGGIHVVNDAPVCHHRAETNRLTDGVAQERRMLALDYFIQTRPELAGVSTAHFLWSLVGAGILHAASGNRAVSRAMFRAFTRVATGRNPYRAGRGAEPLGPPPAGAP